jgi:hypothetical protein
MLIQLPSNALRMSSRVMAVLPFSTDGVANEDGITWL